MIFRFFTRFVKNVNTPFQDDLNDLTDKYNDLVDDLNTGLSRLKLEENFESYKTQVTIPATSELKIPHNLGGVPSDRLILRQSGNGLVVDGPTDWDENNIYLRNEGLVSVTITVLILR